MSSKNSRLIFYFSLVGFLAAGVMLLGLWGPESGLLQDAYHAESERLFQAFASPLAKAGAMGDDLARVDELRRIQKLPGISSARVLENVGSASRENALVWEGKTVGALEIRLRPTRWRMWRYRWMERALTLGIVFVLVAGLAGFAYGRLQERHRLRVTGMFRHQRARLVRRNQSDIQSVVQERNRWLMQAVEWSGKGLLALDESQRIVTANTEAMTHFKLGPEALGAHWLDCAGSPEWAAALCRSIENPGSRVAGPARLDSTPVFLLTFLKPDSPLPESTWIVIG